MNQVCLIRHGLTEANQKLVFCGSTDVPLAPEGREELISKRARGGYPSPEGFRVFTSGLKRTEETLSLLFGPLPHECLPGLAEISFGIFEGLTYEQGMEDPDFRFWIEDSARRVPPGGESGEQMSARVLSTFEPILRSGEDCLLVVHGGTVSRIMEHCFPAEHKSRYDWQPANGEGYRVWVENGVPLRYDLLPETE